MIGHSAMPVIFAKTRYQYDSYVDFWELVRLSGFSVRHIDEIDLSENTTYVFTPANGEIRPHIVAERSRRSSCIARTVWWNLERPDEGAKSAGQHVMMAEISDMMRYVDAVWVSDRAYAAMDARLIHAVLGSDTRLRRTNAHAPKKYDVCHMSYLNGRRSPIISTVSRTHSVAPAAWGNLRDVILKSSRLMLNVHQTSAPVGEPLRFALAASYGLPLVTETLADSWPLKPGEDFLQSSIKELPAITNAVLRDNSRLAVLGSGLHRRLTEEWTFRRGVEDALRRTPGLSV